MSPRTTVPSSKATAVLAPAIRLRGLTRSFDDTHALRGIDLDVGDGEFFSLLGPSGCGKTTLLRIIAGLEHPSAGGVEVRGLDVTGVPPHRRPVSTVFQQYALFPHLDVFENVAFGLRERRVNGAKIARRVTEMLELVGLQGRERAQPAQLSGGQQQRVAVARSLVLEPEVLLLDEPLGALDLALRQQMQKLLRRIQQAVGITFVYVTHDQGEAFSMSDHLAVFRDGRIEQVGTPREVYQRPATAFVAEFLGSPNRFAGTIESCEEGRYDVAIPGLGHFDAPGVAGLRNGTDVELVVRPEAIELYEPAAGTEDTVVARVVEVTFLGSQVAVELQTPSGTVIQVSQPGDADTPSNAVPCHLRWPPDRSWVVPRSV